MWTDSEANLTANYDSSVAGQPYKDFAAQLKAVQAGSWAQDPTVIINVASCKICSAASNTSILFPIQLFSLSDTPTSACPGVAGVNCHIYTTCGIVGQN